MLRGVLFLLFLLSYGASAAELAVESKPIYYKYVTQDYIDQLYHIRDVYLQTASLIHLKSFQKKYLRNLYRKIRRGNKDFFPVETKPHFFVVKSETPFYFALPANHYIFSSGLIKKYFKNEITLRAALTFMMLQCQNLVYLKNILVPIGFYSTDLLLSITRIPLKLKEKLNQSAYWVFENSGVGGEYYLLWIQLQNRNTLDFVRQIGDPQFITREEYLFKQFVSKRSDFKVSDRGVERNSSGQFYRFIRSI